MPNKHKPMLTSAPRAGALAALLSFSLYTVDTSAAPLSPACPDVGEAYAKTDNSAPTVSLSTAREKAAHEGKVLLVDFWAGYCLPCRMMDETTFSDPAVLDYLRANYVSIKIDVENFDGIAIQQQYGVGELPTMILFASTGEEVDRIEGTVTAGELLARLRENDRPEHRRTRPDARPVPGWSEPFAKMSNAYAEAESEIASGPTTESAPESTPQAQAPSSPTVPAEAEAVLAQAPPALSHESELAVAESGGTVAIPEPQAAERVLATAPTLEAAIATSPAPVEHPATSPTEAASPANAALSTLSPTSPTTAEEAFPVHARITYSLQVGAFAELANAHRTAETLEGLTDVAVDIEADAEGGAIVYRVLAGAFETRAEAEALREALEPSGLKAFAMTR